MKINSETRLLIVLGLIVLLSGGGMFLLNRAPGVTPTPAPTPVPLAWTPATFDALMGKARHVRGDAKGARFTIVEFGDIQCPPCRHAYNGYLVTLEKKMPIRLAFFQFPWPQHEQALPAALATEAASRQGKFWQMFDALYTGVDTTLGPVFYEASAQKVGLDMKRFDADSQDPAVKAIVDADQRLAQQDHISSTPAFVVKDEKTGDVFVVSGGDKLDTQISQRSGTPSLIAQTPAK